MSSAIEQDPGKTEEKLANFCLIVIQLGQGSSLHYQLHRSYAIPFHRIDHLAATTATATSLVVTGHQVAKMSGLQVLLSSHRQKSPVLSMHLNRLFDELIKLSQTSEAIETLNSIT